MQRSIDIAWHSLVCHYAPHDPPVMTCHTLSLSVSRLPIGRCRYIYQVPISLSNTLRNKSQEERSSAPPNSLEGMRIRAENFYKGSLPRFAVNVAAMEHCHVHSRSVYNDDSPITATRWDA
jgi:hypothetical protein